VEVADARTSTSFARGRKPAVSVDNAFCSLAKDGKLGALRVGMQASH